MTAGALALLPALAQTAVPAPAPVTTAPATPAPSGSTPAGQTPGAASATPAPAPGIPQPPGPAADVWMPEQTVQLRVMNKVDSHPQMLTVQVGQSASFGSLTIVPRSCLARPADQIQDWAAYLDITDSRQGEPSFHGWMLAKEPWIGVLQHPVYDVRLVGCS